MRITAYIIVWATACEGRNCFFFQSKNKKVEKDKNIAIIELVRLKSVWKLFSKSCRYICKGKKLWSLSLIVQLYLNYNHYFNELLLLFIYLKSKCPNCCNGKQFGLHAKFHWHFYSLIVSLISIITLINILLDIMLYGTKYLYSNKV